MKGFLEAFAGEVLQKTFQKNTCMKGFLEGIAGEVLQTAFQNTKLLWKPFGKLLQVKCFQKPFKIQSYYERFFGSFCR